MSWLFGSGKSNVQLPPGAPSPPPDPAKDNDKKSTQVKAGAYSFDSEALERAAKAAKDLETSKYAGEAFKLSKENEKTKQLEYQTSMKKYELEIAHWQTEHLRVQEEEKRRRMVEESKQQKSRADYQDHLSRQRHQDQLLQQKKNQEEILQRQEASVQKQESMKRQTIDYQAELAHANALKEIEAKMVGRAKAERENHDIRMERLRAEAVEHRETVLSSIKNIGEIAGRGLNDFFHDKTKVGTLIVGVTLTAAGISGSRTLFRFVESRIGKPSLIRETSRINMIDLFRHPIKTIKSRLNRPEDPLGNIVLNPGLEERLRRLAIATRHTKANNGFYRNALLFGPPGTGKTFYAKSLAMASNMDYAIMSGGDVTPLGGRGVTEMHKIFNWAQTSRKGLMLFIDEADAFLYKRNQVQISENLRSTLNAFLQRTGEQSKKFMVVFATNAPEQFDWAVNSRIDEVVEFPLPDLSERVRLVRQYFYEYVLLPASSKTQRIRLESGDTRIDWESKCNDIAAMTEGLSGRDIAKIAVDWQASAYSSDQGVLTEKMMDQIVDEAKEAYNTKEEWRKYKLPTAIKADAQQSILAPLESNKIGI